MKTRLISLILCLALALGLTACGAARTEPAAPAENDKTDTPVTGGWALTLPEEGVALPEEVAEAFEKSSAANAGLTPAACVGQQVVAGMNYMLLCAAEDGWQMAVIYRDLQGEAELTQQHDFELTDYTQGGAEAPAEMKAGGWAAPDEATSLPLPQDAQEALDKALSSFVGSNIEPMALLGTQVVAGTNYAILCRVTPVTPAAVASVQVVTVYADLQGNASFTNFCAVDPADYNK